MVRKWLSRHGAECAVGLALTFAAILLHLAGVRAMQRLELLGFDYQVRSLSRIGASDKIVHIDIDDSALDLVGRWPWPRDKQAQIVRILHELGAGRIVMDIVWAEREGPRLDFLESDADLGELANLFEQATEANVIRSDDELAAAIAEAGNVYLATYSDPKEQRDFSPLQQQMAELLRGDFGLDGVAVAERLGRLPKEVSAVLPGVKRRVARELVRRVLDANPSASPRDVHAVILQTPYERETADRKDVQAAYDRERALRELRRRDLCPPVPAGLKGKLPLVRAIVPPLAEFAAGARGVGLVTGVQDIDGQTRHLPLLAEWEGEGRLIEQLAFATMRDLLGIRLEDLSIDAAGDLAIAARGDRPAMRVQLDEDGQMLVNWRVGSGRWEDCFRHLPVAWLLGIYDCRWQAKQNEIRRQEAIGQAMRLALGEEGFAPYRELYNRMLQRERAARQARFEGHTANPGRGPSRDREGADTMPADGLETEARQLRQEVEQQQRETRERIDQAWTELQAEPDPKDPEIATDYKRFAAAKESLARADQLQRINDDIDQRRQKLVNDLRPLVEGKICLVGYTASNLADMVTTPAYERQHGELERTPGVLVHSNALNNFLKGEFRSWSRRPVQVAVIALFGLGVTLLTVTHGPRDGLIVLLMVVTASILVNGVVVFGWLNHWLPLVTAMLLACVAWAMIVLFRYLVTERERRRFSRAVAQYVSPAMARRIADSAANIDLSPVSGVVTCFFSDLQGFTPMSEALGPEGTKTVLNPYLEAMSNALHRHEALINKFMGDGIFAFFNCPILPHEAHEEAACAAALACQEELQALIRRHEGHPLAAHFGKLFMRIGVASGPVFVGDYGSESKLDYTCMGDTVNLAARLESANKQFGTAVMVAGGTHARVAGRYCFRHLGSLQVKGQSLGVPVYELLGRLGEVDEATLRFARTFERGVEAFGRREWDGCTAAFEECLRGRPADAGVTRYLDQVRAYRQSPPPEDWRGGLELTEK